MKMMYRGFSTSVCVTCQGIEVPEEEQSHDALLYPDKPAEEKIGTAKALFRALGFGRPKEPKPKAAESAKIVKEKKRKPLFGPDEK